MATHDRPDFPSMAEVNKASHEQLAYWYRFLPHGSTVEENEIMEKLVERFKKMGGMTAALSEKIGRGGV